MHHLAEPAVGAQVVYDEGAVVSHTQGRWRTVWVLVQALDVSTWPL